MRPGVEQDTAAETVARHVVPEPEQTAGVGARRGMAGFVLEGEKAGTPLRHRVDLVVPVLGAEVIEAYPTGCFGLDPELGRDKGIEHPPPELGGPVDVIHGQPGHGP